MAYEDSIVVATKMTKSNKHWTHLAVEFRMVIDEQKSLILDIESVPSPHPHQLYEENNMGH